MVPVPVKGCKKRHRSDGQDCYPPSSKKFFAVAEGERDSSINSDSGTITCLGSTGWVRDQLVRRNSANSPLDWGSSSASFSASELTSTSAGVTSVVSFVEGATRERRESCHIVKSKGNHLTNINPYENRRLDADLEVSSGVTLQNNESSGESILTMYENIRRNKIWVDGVSQLRPEIDGYRNKTREGHTWHSLADREIEGSDMRWRATIADDTGSSCIEPYEDLLSEEQRLRCAHADASRPNNESLMQGVATYSQCAGLSDFRGYCAKPSIDTEIEWEQDYYASQLPFNDKANDDAFSPAYVISSGRPTQEEVSRSGQRPSTIDIDFEEYFGALML